jgi:maltose O-acetyltransferase
MLRNTQRGKRIRCYGRVLVEGGSGITVSDRVVFLKGMLPTELRCAPGAELVIGTQTLFNYGVSVVAQHNIRVGKRCRIGSLVQIRDDDGRRAAPVVIGDDVWLAHGVLVEPGVVIGDGAVVAAGAVVSASIPPRMLAFGNPVRIFPLEGSGAGHADWGGGANGGTETGIPLQAVEPRATPSRDVVRAAIIDWLDDTRHFGEAASLLTSDSVSLREAGLLDSLGLVELVLMLEGRFGVQIDRELVARTDHQSMKTFVDVVTKQSPSSPAAPP